MGSTASCPFCGRDLEPLVVEFGGRSSTVGYRKCGCAGQIRYDSETSLKAASDAMADKECRRMRSLSNAGIAPRFMDAETDEEVRSLYIVGPVGVGKTHLASALVRKSVESGVKAVLASSVCMLASIRSSYGIGTDEGDAISAYTGCEVLAIDDLGKENPTEWALSMLYRIVDARYCSMMTTIVTTQYERDELIGRMGAENRETAVAIVSRLHEMCELMRLEGDDRRIV